MPLTEKTPIKNPKSKTPGGRSIRKSLAYNAAWNTLGLAVYFACQWLITLIVVWLYDDFTNAGNLALAMNITNIFHTIAMYNIRAYQVSDIQRSHSDSDYVAARLITCIASILLCAGFVFISGYPDDQVLIILCYMGFRLVEAIVDVLHGIVHKRGRLDIPGISMVARGLLMLGAFSILGWAFDLLPAIIGMLVVTALFGLLFDVPKAIKMMERTSFALSPVLDLLKRCFPLMLVILLMTLIVSYTRYALERVYGTAELGAYATAVTPAIAIQVAATFLFAPLMNLFSECIKESNRARFLNIFFKAGALIGGLTLAAVVVANIAGEWGLELLFGASIIPYAYLLPWAIVAAGLTASLAFLNVVFTTVRDIKWLLCATAVGTVICVTAAEFFLRQYGLNGANYSLIVCQGVTLTILCVRFFWNISKNIPVSVE